MKTISALTLRKKLGAILDEVERKKNPIAITRANRLMVVMEPYASYEVRSSQEARREHLLEVTRRMEEGKKRNAKHLKGIDSVKVIREMRDSR